MQDHLFEHFKGEGHIAFLGNVSITLIDKIDGKDPKRRESCYGSIPLNLGLIGRDGGLSTLCDSCGFACQQSVLSPLRG